MKKIVMGLAAVAMAASMFATDFTGELKLTGDLFNYNTESGAMKVLSAIGSEKKAEASLTLASEKVGATVKIEKASVVALGWEWNDGLADDVKIDDNKWDPTYGEMSFGEKEFLTLSGSSIWWKPIDALKLSLNGNELSMKVKDDWEIKSGEGYGAEYTAGDFVGSVTLKGDWVAKEDKDADTTINNIGLKAVYDNADAGKVTAIAVFGPTDKNFKTIDLGLNYVKDFDGVKVDAMGLIWLNDGYNKAAAYVDVTGTAGDVAYEVKPVINTTKDAATQIDTLLKATVADVTCEVTPKFTLQDGADTVVGLNASVAYTIEGIGLKAIYDNGNFDANDGSIALEVTGTFDVMSWKVAPKFDMDKDTFSTAFETKVTF